MALRYKPGENKARMARSVLSAVVLTMLPHAAWSEGDQIKARKDNFGVLSDQMKVLVKGLGDGVPIGALQASVDRARTALAHVPGLFPEGSGLGDTSALPVVWTDPDRFKAAYDGAASRMAELVVAAQQDDRDVFGAAVGRMVAACGTCHQSFRSP